MSLPVATPNAEIFLPLVVGQSDEIVAADSMDGDPATVQAVMGLPDATPNVEIFLPLIVSQGQHPYPPSPTDTVVSTTVATTLPAPVVFVSRRILPEGSNYYKTANAMPGVGAHSRFRVAAPGKLILLNPDGSTRILVDGSKPSSANLKLIDVNAPDVSYDGSKIVFAGVVADGYDPVKDTRRGAHPGKWRLYVINVDGTNLRQLTFSDQILNYSQFGTAKGAFQAYDDTDPAWLPDGRIVFASTRWPGFAQYSGTRTTNLYVVNADGSNLHRITAERNGADRPIVDPFTGKIVYARWWRNHRFAVNSMDTIVDSRGGYVQKDGLTTNRQDHVGGSNFLVRNRWHAGTINPDGTGLAQWGGPQHKLLASHVYGGAFTARGDFIANFFPTDNMAEAAGFGGLRLYQRGPGTFKPLMGVTDVGKPLYTGAAGIYPGPYISEPAVLPDGRLIVSWAKDIVQDYGLYIVNADGTHLTLLYNTLGATELRAKLVQARPLPPIIPDTVTQVASLLPPTANGPYAQDGTFVFEALNVYFNGPVDGVDNSAPAVGSADRIRFFLDHQRTSPGSFPYQDWPILLGEQMISPDGFVREPNAPANLPLFEQIRSKDNTVPLTPGSPGGAAHVAGMNFGRPGTVVRCVGCHAGHTMIPVPENPADAQWTNLAPGAVVTVSSTRDAKQDRGLVDRRVMTGPIAQYWASAAGQTNNQWVQLTFPVPVTVRTVRLYNPRFGDKANSSVQVQGVTVRLYSDAAGTTQVASQTAGALSVQGTDVAFAEVRARSIRVEITGVTGTFFNAKVASLAEIEVIARGEAGP